MSKRTFAGEIRDLAAKQGWIVSEAGGRQGPISRDLFGFIDWVALDGQFIIALQITSRSNMASRVKKILCHCDRAAIRWLTAGGKISVVGFGDEHLAKLVQIYLDSEGRLIASPGALYDLDEHTH